VLHLAYFLRHLEDGDEKYDVLEKNGTMIDAGDMVSIL